MKKILGPVTAATALCISSGIPAHAATTPQEKPRYVYYTVSSSSRLPDTMSRQTVESLSGAITTYSVPSGYTLRGRKIDAYHYRSDQGYLGNYKCVTNVTNCHLANEVALQYRATLQGGTSKKWHFSAYARQLKSNGSKWWMTYGYSCGVNVKGEADHTCGSGASASHTSGTLPNQREIWKDFEHRNSGINYQMVAISVHWSDGGQATGKFRGWDVCNKTRPAYCTNTGNGL